MCLKRCHASPETSPWFLWLWVLADYTLNIPKPLNPQALNPFVRSHRFCHFTWDVMLAIVAAALGMVGIVLTAKGLAQAGVQYPRNSNIP